MVSDRKLANAVGGKSARACDNCIKKRARWYCAADDVFLCQSCDSSVHSANPLSRRHERVRLKTASFNSSDEEHRPKLQISVPTWHHGFTRKARTPRQKKHGAKLMNPLHLVPEMLSEEQSHEENEEQLLYRVPIFDPFDAVITNHNDDDDENRRNLAGRESKATSCDEFSQEMKHLQGFLPSEMDLADFAADVESLLGKGLEDETFDMEGLGILNCDEGKLEEKVVKVEDEGDLDEENGHHEMDLELEMGRETFELNFDYDSPITCEEEDNTIKGKTEESNNKTLLKLDYEGVMSAWDDQKSPWTTGERPELNPDDWWPDCVGTSGTMQYNVYGETGMMINSHAAAMGAGGREARVSRYREKRRTRLFSKKIRYEVRKLNAEKRPRMKGRFVKRANFVPPAVVPGFQFAQ